MRNTTPWLLSLFIVLLIITTGCTGQYQVTEENEGDSESEAEQSDEQPAPQPADSASSPEGSSEDNTQTSPQDPIIWDLGDSQLLVSKKYGLQVAFPKGWTTSISGQQLFKAQFLNPEEFRYTISVYPKPVNLPLEDWIIMQKQFPDFVVQDVQLRSFPAKKASVGGDFGVADYYYILRDNTVVEFECVVQFGDNHETLSQQCTDSVYSLETFQE